MKPQATKIDQDKDPRISEPAGCLIGLLLFMAMIGAVYACPFVIGWAIGAYP